MDRSSPSLVIDARPRGPRGPMAGEIVLGRSVLAHLVEMAEALEPSPIAIHARADEHVGLRPLVGSRAGAVVFATGPPPEGAAVLRADRLYDPERLRRALHKGRDLESAVVWRLDRPAALAGADDELLRRMSYQPLGRYWALPPARLLAKLLTPTFVRPNALTYTSGLLMVGAAVAVAVARGPWPSRFGPAIAMAAALVLDTADGHLARLQGTASEFGRWLDANLDELGDMALHAAIAWAAFARDGLVVWLGLGMLYAMGKYLFQFATTSAPPTTKADSRTAPTKPSVTRAVVHLAGHADVRWHLWIALAAVGRLDVALVAYAVYFPVRTIAVAARRAVSHA
jgi:CDP-alcohol phosphatidyltransferase